MRRLGFVAGVLALAATLASPVGDALGQGAPPTPQQKTAAARKFKEGEKAFSMHDYRTAAQAFEEAYAIAPHPDVLFNAIDAREKGGELAAAATLCERVVRDFPTPDIRSEANGHLAKYLPKLGRLDITLAPGGSGVALDGRPANPGVTYVDPGDHIVTANINGIPFERRLTLVAGARETVQIIPGPPQPEQPRIVVRPKQQNPIHPAIFFTGAGLTLVSAALLTWSGIDTNQARDEFDKNPTKAGLNDGKSKQLRTNVLVGTTAGLGAVTAVLGIFVEWSILSPDEPAPRQQLSPGQPPNRPLALRVSPLSIELGGTF